MDRVVLCMKWGTLYGPDYVNVLYSAVRRNLTGDFRFVCLTDDPAGIRDEVECHPIPDIGLKHENWYHGAWPKIAVFLPDLYGLTGRALFIDLDMIICGPLDEFFTYDQGLVTIDEGVWNGTPPSTMTSIFAFDLGQMGYLVDRIRADRDAICAKYDIEQNYLHGEVERIGYWPHDWLVSFKRHLRQPLLIDRFKQPKWPEPGVKIIVFHGRPRPMDLIRPGGGNRDLFPHCVPGQVDWARDYWLENGGRL
ncbi:glycosyltransferase [Thalassobius vesicularis]|uniref:Glycosyltransferase n=1 Tax=Thalassobius vesicularis TaxID=1294297 RepID=A0A4S3M577_9RHOB|nr:glycosyltransferase [Thalassobius vesicularis]THD71609.1 glycosyltransferase [Thalassobius vesicularis]